MEVLVKTPSTLDGTIDGSPSMTSYQVQILSYLVEVAYGC